MKWWVLPEWLLFRWVETVTPPDAFWCKTMTSSGEFLTVIVLLTNDLLNSSLDWSVEPVCFLVEKPQFILLNTIAATFAITSCVIFSLSRHFKRQCECEFLSSCHQFLKKTLIGDAVPAVVVEVQSFKTDKWDFRTEIVASWLQLWVRCSRARRQN